MRRLLLLLSVPLLLSCSSNSSSPPIDDGALGPSEPTYPATGQTGFTLSSDDGKFTITAPPGSLPPELGAQPQLSPASPDSGQLLSGGETVVSGAYLVDLQSVGNFVGANIEVHLGFDSSQIPAAQLDALHVYAKVLHDGGPSLQVSGQLSGSQLVLSLPGIAQKATYAVVFNPTRAQVLGDPPARDRRAPPSPGERAPLAPRAPRVAWPTTSWFVRYDSAEPNLRAAVAAFLHTTADALTAQQIADVLKSNLADNATKASNVYFSAGFRPPLIATANAAAAGQPQDLRYPIELTDDGSFYQPRFRDENGDHVGFSYGTLFIDPSRLTQQQDTLGTVLASVAHEMFHGVQYSYGNLSTSIEEGSAATYGVTIDRAAASPQVRAANPDEIFRLSNYLLVPFPERSAAIAYSNQDFFAWIGRAHGGEQLGYLAAMFEKIKSSIDALVAAGNTSARIAPDRVTLLQAIDASFIAQFGSGLSILYPEFARDRAMDHTEWGQLRTTDPTAQGLDPTLFSAAAIASVSVDPTSLTAAPATGVLDKIWPMSAKVLVLTPTQLASHQGAKLSVTPDTGSLGHELRAVVYRNGIAEEMSGDLQLNDFANADGDGLTVVFSNVDTAAAGARLTWTLSGVPNAVVSSFHAVVGNLSADCNTTDNVFDAKLIRTDTLSNSTTHWQAYEATYPDLGRHIELLIPGPPVAGTTLPLGAYTESSSPPIALVTLIDDRNLDPNNPTYTKTWCTGAGVSAAPSGGALTIESVVGSHVVVSGYGANLGNCGSGLATGTFSISSFRAEADVDGL